MKHSAYVYDAGALIALDRLQRDAVLRHREAVRAQRLLLVPSVVLTQVWRDPRRQQGLAKALASCRVVPVDADLARAGGVLCSRAGTSDAVDALVMASAVAAGQRCVVFTSDPKDLAKLRDVAPDPKQVLIEVC